MEISIGTQGCCPVLTSFSKLGSAQVAASSSGLLMGSTSEHQQGQLVEIAVKFCDAITDDTDQNMFPRLSVMHSWHYTGFMQPHLMPTIFYYLQKTCFFFYFLSCWKRLLCYSLKFREIRREYWKLNFSTWWPLLSWQAAD